MEAVAPSRSSPPSGGQRGGQFPAPLDACGPRSDGRTDVSAADLEPVA